ncbi:MAG TPA: ATP-binding protein [Candidatus Tumulicola sp.]|nr:ATP-binding protein [Candidatus Tumulicola sp.]
MSFLFDPFRRSRAEQTASPVNPPASEAELLANALADRFDALVEALPVGVIVVGAKGQVRVFNQAAAEIFGVARERALARSLIESVRSFELDRRLTAALRDGTEQTAELEYVAGVERRMEVTTRPLRSPNGPREAVAVITDITRVRELEAIRRDFVSNVSHELRTPLTSVKIIVETLQAGVNAGVQKEFLANIARETDRMIALVEDLLRLAKIESGAIERPFEAVDLAELCREVVDMQAPRALALNVDLRLIAPPNPVIVSGDRDKLVQVVVNLLDNALRIVPSGGKIEVAIHGEPQYAELTVEDNGPGIPSAALPHIFERFYVVERSRSRVSAGTGLGLAIVKHIMEQHGGSVTAESELGVGTTFRCRFRKS